MEKIHYIASRVLVWLFCISAVAVAEKPQPPFEPSFYPFQNGMRFKSVEEGVKLIKDLGYQGVGSSEPRNLAQFKAACEKEGLKIFSVYLGGKVNADNFSYGNEINEAIAILKGTDALLELNVQRGNDPNDAQAIAMVKEIGEKAKAAGLKVVIYPHDKFYIERVDHAVKIAKATGCDNVGVAFNLCHFLKVQPKDDLAATLTDAKPLLWSVSISGADLDGKDWNTLIRPLDEGTFDTSVVIKHLRDMGFKGAIGLQCFNIRIDANENLTRSMQAWKKHLALCRVNVSNQQ
jgi:sugar phosphate isomerase/epimerase